jgi:hypothetical protein
MVLAMVMTPSCLSLYTKQFLTLSTVLTNPTSWLLSLCFTMTTLFLIE